MEGQFRTTQGTDCMLATHRDQSRNPRRVKTRTWNRNRMIILDDLLVDLYKRRIPRIVEDQGLFLGGTQK